METSLSIHCDSHNRRMLASCPPSSPAAGTITACQHNCFSMLSLLHRSTSFMLPCFQCRTVQHNPTSPKHSIYPVLPCVFVFELPGTHQNSSHILWTVFPHDPHPGEAREKKYEPSIHCDSHNSRKFCWPHFHVVRLLEPSSPASKTTLVVLCLHAVDVTSLHIGHATR